MNDPDKLEQRVELLERQIEELRRSWRSEMKLVAHELRADSDFMKPASEKFVDHAGSHLFDKAARRLLWVVLGIFGSAAVGLAVLLAGKGMK